MTDEPMFRKLTEREAQRRRNAIISVVAISVVGLFFMAWITDEDYTTAEQLAIIDSAGAREAGPYERALDRAEPSCWESRDEIADVVVAGQSAAEARGVDVTLLELLEAIPVAAPDGPWDCSEVVGGLVVMLVGQ